MVGSCLLLAKFMFRYELWIPSMNVVDTIKLYRDTKFHNENTVEAMFIVLAVYSEFPHLHI